MSILNLSRYSLSALAFLTFSGHVLADQMPNDTSFPDPAAEEKFKNSSFEENYFDLSRLTIPEARATDIGIQYVDMHAVFVADISGSVTALEKQTMLEGIANAFKSKEAERVFVEKTKYAITFIYYADTAKSSKTFIVETPEDAVRLAENTLWNTEYDKLATVLPNVGSRTKMVPPLIMAQALFKFEEDRGIKAIDRAVVVFADDPPDDQNHIKEIVLAISTDYGATVYGIPIVPNSVSPELTGVSKFFSAAVFTPQNLASVDEWGVEQPVRPGFVSPATSVHEITKPVTLALNLSTY